MKKTVPFKKDIVFDTAIEQINSISLEHSITEKKGNLIAGKFLINGDYKMTTSENLDVFEYELPFNINIDKKYYIDEADVEISDFYYEVINNKILSVNIELEVDNIEENQVEEPQLVEEETLEKEDDREVAGINDLFSPDDENETYSTYKIHIIRENDTVESIMLDYEISKEKLEDYNDLTEIKTGDKLIIPANEN